MQINRIFKSTFLHNCIALSMHIIYWFRIALGKSNKIYLAVFSLESDWFSCAYNDHVLILLLFSTSTISMGIRAHIPVNYSACIKEIQLKRSNYNVLFDTLICMYDWVQICSVLTYFVVVVDVAYYYQRLVEGRYMCADFRLRSTVNVFLFFVPL